MTTPLPTIDAIRDHFPALSGDTILLENAGGSQVPRCVADGIRDHCLNNYVQLGAGYPMSNRATARASDPERGSPGRRMAPRPWRSR